MHGLYSDQIKMIPGFYDCSLDDGLAQNLKQTVGKASLICIDCDLYESAVPVFRFIEEFLQPGTLVYIDDYWVGYQGNPDKGVSKAFNEYREGSSWKFVEWLDVGWAGKSFVCYS